ncbi:MAG: phosphate/phosphite/phosphonate ABC transporter substrate-binding protein [Verrucomicrobiae bacterium]|nr:phosphate/phosphite/phosphonate ABC transporter substrate-binding protein [Verrucomicrobiae bacterium]
MKKSLPCLLMAVCLLHSACTPKKSAATEAKPETGSKIIVALKPDKDPQKMLEERTNLASFLSAKMGRPVEVIVPLSSAVIQEGFANGTIDLGYLSSTDMVTARKNGAADLLLAGEIDGKTTYESYWLCLKEKPYSSVRDLKGKKVAFASRTSTSGCIIPLNDLYEQGLLGTEVSPESFFGTGNVWYGSGYTTATDRVFSGDAEAAAVSDYVFNKDKHLTAEQRDKLKVLDTQGPVPTHTLAVRKTLSPAERDRLKAALLSLNEEPHTALRDKVFTSKIVEVDADGHLAPIQKAMEVHSRLK